MTYKAHLLIIGVNYHFEPTRVLRAAERDAKAIYGIFESFGFASTENLRLLLGDEVTPAKVNQELDRLRNIKDGDFLFIYWAGHAEKSEDEVYLVTKETRSRSAPNAEMIALERLVANYARAGGFKHYVLIVDTCCAGAANDIANKIELHYNATSKSEVLAACQANEIAREDPTGHGWLTGILLEELDKARTQGNLNLNFSEVLSSTTARLGKEKNQKAKYSTNSTGEGAIFIPVLPKPTDWGTPDSTDPLEEALGYATQAFRTYLNENIVEDVELIYFLGFDVWDGCLVYDGLVYGSIEQQLLNFIRRQFLDRDRLRSKYEELLANNKENELGVAGQCLHAAQNSFQKILERIATGDNLDSPLENPTLRGLRYIGDINAYESEYRHYDQLLGLRSCLYIPVVKNLNPRFLNSSDEEAKHYANSELHEYKYARKPVGGVLIAANRTAYGLIPKQGQIRERFENFRNQYQENPTANHLREWDETITVALQEQLRRNPASNTPDESTDSYQQLYQPELHSFLRCIGAVYMQRAERRMGLRQGLHPSFVKAGMRQIKDVVKKTHSADSTASQLSIDEIVEKISHEVERERTTTFPSPLEFARYLRNVGIGKFLPKDLEGANQLLLQKLTRDYLIATVWRDLEIQRRKVERVDERSTVRGNTTLGELIQELQTPLPEFLLSEELKKQQQNIYWGRYVSGQQFFKRMQHPTTRRPPSPGEIRKLNLDLLNDLLDDLREAKRSPFEIVYDPIQQLAPVSEYIASFSKLEGIFGSSVRERIFCDLSHSLLVWLLGLWVLETQISNSSKPGESIRDRVTKYVEEYFKTPQQGYRRASPWPQNLAQESLDLYWGLVAATHDIAVPVQQLNQLCRNFFKQFFREDLFFRNDASHNFATVDILDHPRFPIYKSAITSLYRTQERDWLEGVFYHALRNNVGHAAVGALILVHELEPYSEYTEKQALWQLIRIHLEALSKEHKSQPEQGLFLPAYLAHAVAFSHLPELRELWKRMTRRWDSGEHKKYLLETSNHFRVSFEQYPLTYLLGLFETILEPTDESNLLRGIEFANNIQPQVNQTESKFYTFTGCSSFYIENVEAQADISRSTSGSVILSLTIRLWENNLEQESCCMYLSEMKNLYIQYRQKIEQVEMPTGIQDKWYLYTQKKFDDESKNPSIHHPVMVYREYYEILNHNERQKYLSPRAYNILRLFVSLKDFEDCFTSENLKINIKFSNVVREDRSAYCFIYPDDLPR